MSNESKLGTIPNGNEGRDAVHIAIMPACAAEIINVGYPVKLNSDNMAEECEAEEAVGVADPFLCGISRIAKGAWFWLCLYPITITGLRHVWEHPAFPLSEVKDKSAPIVDEDKKTSEQWLKDYVRQHCPYWENESDGGYGEFIRHVDDERWIYYYGSDCHSLADVEDADLLFKHLSVILGKRIDASYFEAFTCSC